MELIKEAIQEPFENLLGLFIYFSAVVLITIAIAGLALYLIPNPLSNRIKNLIISGITFTVIFIWIQTVILN
ncbi:hypothetical protein SAMN04488134_101601 [Amphibacillus marinus]|uniref:Uncharacterized protein n=1 Tax=Amphibacillus marinus TaxID=872970 RepID=A0A1H8IE02_9BACI|nr:hypothetical protein [Amphibacillus marinus]SEN67013.1 hypothetical protein SAMN04488134_101601 [Amphibacillus marinus]